MKKQQIGGLFALLLVTVLTVWSAGDVSALPEAAPEGEQTYVQLLAAAPVAQVEGEAVSPNGRYKVRTAGASDSYVSGVRIPEALQIVNIHSGEVMWEDVGYLWQSVSWSPGNHLVAIARGGRTWHAVTVISTADWTNWDVTLPDGGGIPEYTFLPEENWCEWLDVDSFLLTVGLGGDAGEQHTYRCHVSTSSQSEELRGSSEERITEVLPGAYDFDHDGEMERAVAAEYGDPDKASPIDWYELRIGEWMQEAYVAHVGWMSIFALEIDGQDYLLRYTPQMSTGCAYYAYQIFSLDEAGEEVLLKENSVEFDVNFGSDSLHHSFDPAEIAAFLEEVHGYLDDSTLLLSTEGGGFRTGGSGAEFQEDCNFWDEFCPYDEERTLEENLKNYAERLTAARSGQS